MPKGKALSILGCVNVVLLSLFVLAVQGHTSWGIYQRHIDSLGWTIFVISGYGLLAAALIAGCVRIIRATIRSRVTS